MDRQNTQTPNGPTTSSLMHQGGVENTSASNGSQTSSLLGLKIPEVPDEYGKYIGLLAYLSVFVSAPLLAIAFFVRTDLSLFHARRAAVLWGLVQITLTFALYIIAPISPVAALVPLLFVPLPMAAAVHGIILSLNEERRDPIGCSWISKFYNKYFPRMA